MRGEPVDCHRFLSHARFPRDTFYFPPVVRRELKILTESIEREGFFGSIYCFVTETSGCGTRIFVVLTGAITRRGLHGAGVVAGDTCAAR